MSKSGALCLMARYIHILKKSWTRAVTFLSFFCHHSMNCLLGTCTALLLFRGAIKPCVRSLVGGIVSAHEILQ